MRLFDLAKRTLRNLTRKRQLFQNPLLNLSSRRTFLPRFEVLESRRVLALVTWDGGGGEFDLNWNNGMNWSNDTKPSSSDDVFIGSFANPNPIVISGAPVEVQSIRSNHSVTVNSSLILSAPTEFHEALSVVGNLTTNSDVDVTGKLALYGTLNGANGQGSLLAAGGSEIYFAATLANGFHFTNPLGQVADVFGQINMLNDGTRITNAGTFNVRSDSGVETFDVAQTYFINSGSIVKLVGSTDPNLVYGSLFNVRNFVSPGLIDIRVGTLALGPQNVTTTIAGPISAAQGTTLWLLNNVNVSGAIDADRVRFHVGTKNISGAYKANYTEIYDGSSTVKFSGPISKLGDSVVVGVNSGGSLDLVDATFVGNATTLGQLTVRGRLVADIDLVVSGTLDWNGGTLQGANSRGSLTIQGDKTFNGTYTVRDFDLINAGNATWSSGTVNFYGNSQFINALGATFTNSFDGTFGSADGACQQFTNNGTFVKSGLTGQSLLRMQLYNSGTVDVQQGQLALSCRYISTDFNPPDPGLVLPPGPPNYEDPIVRPLPVDNPPVVVPGNYTQTVSGRLVELIKGHTAPGPFGIPGTDYGQLVVTGNVALNGNLEVQLMNGFVPLEGKKFKVIDNRGSTPIAGHFTGLLEGDTVHAGGVDFTISYVGGDPVAPGQPGNDVVLTALAPLITQFDISGRIFDDKNNDGAFGELDAGIASISLSLYRSSIAIATATTDSVGRYTFSGLFGPDSYRIVAAQPSGFLDGKETAGTVGGTVNNTQDSSEISFVIPAGVHAADGYNFAEIRPSRIQGMVWLDLNDDGAVDSGERLIAGVAISLSGIDDRGLGVDRATTTNVQGRYEFPDLRPGNYTIAETQAGGYADGRDTLGTVNGTVMGNATVSDRFSDVILAFPGSEAANYNFGERNAVEVELVSVAARPSDTEPSASGLTNIQPVTANPTTSMYLGNLGTSVSADGRFVTFVSAARLATNDTNDLQDVYIRDVQSGITILVSVGIGGASANGISGTPVINADGRYVAFVSSATNLTGKDTNNAADVFVWDRLDGQPIAISKNQDDVIGNGATSSAPRISADGQIVAFSSNATNLVAGPDTNGVSDVFVWDLHNPVAQRLTRLSNTTGGSDPFMSADGQRIVFTSGGLVLYDRTKTINQRSAVGNGQYPTRPEAGSAISADGKHIAYVKAVQPNPSYSTVFYQVYVYHVITGEDELVSRKLVSQPFTGPWGTGSSFRPVISADGSKVAFESTATDLTSTPTQYLASNVYVWDRNANPKIRIVSLSNPTQPYPSQPGNRSFDPRISADGYFVAFVSTSTYITAADTGQPAVMLRDLRPGGLTTRISTSLTSPGYSPLDYSYSPIMSYARDPADTAVSHTAVAFVSYTGDLSTDGDFNGTQDVFLRDLTAQPLSNILISRRDPTLAHGVTGMGTSFARPGSVSADGRYVVFVSDAPNLTSDNANRRQHVLVRDVQSNTTTLVDIGINGAIGNGGSHDPVISANGRFVAFVSLATNLVPNERNNANGYPYWYKTGDVYVRDLWNGTTTLASSSGADSSGIMTGNSQSRSPAIGVDANGQWHVAFMSRATNLDPEHTDSNGAEDVFVRHQNSSRPELVSLSTTGTSGNNLLAPIGSDDDGVIDPPVISADGRYVAFVSTASNLSTDSNLAPNDTNTFQDVFLRDVQTRTTTLVSVSTMGVSGNSASSSPAIAVDTNGHWHVAFVSSASNLTLDNANVRGNVFVRDQLGPTTLASVRMDGAFGYDSLSRVVISADGSHVAFKSSANNLSGNIDTIGTTDIFVRDLRPGGTMSLVSVGMSGAAGNSHSFRPVISADGRYVAFASLASNLTANDANGTIADVFVRDLQTASTTLMSASQNGAGGSSHSQVPVFIDADGQSVVFNSFASNLVGRDYNGVTDVFVARRVGPAGPTEAGGTVTVEMRTDPTDSNLTALFITGSDGSDSILVTKGTGPGDLTVAVNGTTVGTTFHPTGHVYVVGRGGQDDLTIRATAPLGAVVDGEEGVDTVTVFLGAIIGEVTVTDSGSGGSDSLTVNGTPQDDFILKTETLVTLGSPITETIVYSNIGHIIVDGGDGNDIIQDPGSGALILGGEGDDTLIVDATSGSGVWLDGGDGSDTYIAQFGSLFGPVTVADSGNDGTDQLTVLGTDGNDLIDVVDGRVTLDLQTVRILSPIATLTVNAEAGDDQILARTINASVQELILHGGAGNDFFLSSAEAAKLIGGSGDDTYEITGTAGNGVRIEDHDGTTGVIIHLGNLAGPVTVDMGGSTGTVNLTVIGTNGADVIAVSEAGITTGTDEVITLIGFVQQLSIDFGTEGGQLILDDLGLSPTRYNIVAADNGVNVDVQVIGVPPPDLTVNNNHAPTASAGGPYTIGEGGSLVLDASLSTDSDEAGDTLTYEWDFDDDGHYDDAVGVNPIFSAIDLDGFPGAAIPVRLRVTDSAGATSVSTATITITNANPVPSIVSISSPRVEGRSITVVGSATDPAGSNDTLAYDWKVYKDGSSTAFAMGGNSPSFSFTPVDNGSYTIVLSVSDEDGGTATDTAIITVINAAPTASISGPVTGQQGVDIVFQATGVFDPSVADTTSGFTYLWQVTLAGAPVNLSGFATNETALNFVPAEPGTYTVTLTVADKDGGVTAVYRTVVVGATPGMTLLPGGRLVIVGTSGNDEIKVNPGGGASEIKVKLNGTQQTFAGVTEIVIYANAGNDDVQIVGGIQLLVIVFGGAGNDRIRSGSGNSILVGGDGNDTLLGGGGRNILIGGAGADVIGGSGADDVLIAGSTVFDTNVVALGRIGAEWWSERSFADRVANLAGTAPVGATRLNGSVKLTSNGPNRTVFDDAAVDTLSGDGGNDWFLLNSVDGLYVDLVTDMTLFEGLFDTDL